MDLVTEFRLGVLGMSEGNGHPYSWSAIFNGYESEEMKKGLFPTIYEYLQQQKFPDDAITGAKVTHIWTQDIPLSEQIARSSKIPHVVDHYTDMIGQVDGILLARDDAENHYEMSKPFIEAGLPIFIDKPLATEVSTAKNILALQKYPGQVFSCTSLRYADELILNDQDRERIGQIRFIDAVVPKSWNKYAVHVIEPIMNIIGFDKEILSYTSVKTGEGRIVTIEFTGDITCVIKAVEVAYSPISIMVNGTAGYKLLTFKDSFNAFKNSLMTFMKVINSTEKNIPVDETLKVIDIIEKGNTLVNKFISYERL